MGASFFGEDQSRDFKSNQNTRVPDRKCIVGDAPGGTRRDDALPVSGIIILTVVHVK
jgi:hypothetical protein